MWQITEHVQNGRRGLSQAEFESHFVQMCETHRAQGRALAFAFILFDARQPHLRQALDEERYWAALDEQSGRNLTVFAFLAYLRERPPGAPTCIATASKTASPGLAVVLQRTAAGPMCLTRSR